MREPGKDFPGFGLANCTHAPAFHEGCGKITELDAPEMNSYEMNARQ